VALVSLRLAGISLALFASQFARGFKVPMAAEISTLRRIGALWAWEKLDAPFSLRSPGQSPFGGTLEHSLSGKLLEFLHGSFEEFLD
jgi:hypothetical protein